MFYTNNDCAPVVLKKFRTLKGMKKGVNLTTMQSLLKIIQKFKKMASFDVQSGKGWKGIDLTVVEEVVTAVQEELSNGVKQCNA